MQTVEWGGDTEMVQVSAKKRENLDALLETILLTADILNLKASPTRLASGVVLEAKLDRGRGSVATVLVQQGTLRIHDPFIVGQIFGKVRAMFDDKGQAVTEVGPATPVEVLGLQGVPQAGASSTAVVIIGFNVRPETRAADLAKQESVDIRLHSIIYKVEEEIRAAMIGMLEAIEKEKILGKADVREVFRVPRAGTIAGCMVVDGIIRRNARARLIRDGVVSWEGGIASLRRFKDDASEVREGFECGIGLENFNDLKVGDQIEAYIIEKVAATEL